MRRFLLVGLALLATLGILAGAVFGGLEAGDMLWPLAWIMWAPVGAFVLGRKPGNGVGITLLAIGASWGISFLFLAVAESSAPIGVRLWAELVNVVLGVVPWLGIIWLLLIFPTGRLEGLLERIVGVALILFGSLGVLSFVLSPSPMDGRTGLPSPMALEGLGDLTAWVVGDTGFYFVIVLVTASIAALGRRWYRSFGVERHQYRWLLLGAMLFGSVLVLGQFIPEDSSGLYLWLLSGAAIPVVIGIAIVRHHLFDIDRVISRTVAYALLIGVLAAGFFGLATLVGSQISEEPLFVAGATLGAAALFNPLRTWLQNRVDHRFNRSRYDAERVIALFAGSLRDRVDPEGVIEGWVGVVSETMQPTAVSVWVKI